MKTIFVLSLLFMMSGCAGPGMTPEQMKAMAESASSMCIKTPGWNGAAMEVHFANFGGKSVGTAGGGGKMTCGGSTAEFTNDGKAAKAASAP